MKKSVLITIGVIILTLILGVWAYLFTYGVPKNADEVFARFGTATDAGTSVIVDSTRIDTQDTTTTGAPQALKQLTTRPVAGAGFVGTGNGIRYVEQGTGHIYEINLVTGEEKLVSGTTIPGTREAVFSSDGSYVAITMQEGNTEKTLVGTLDTGTQFKGVSLPVGATEIAFGNATGTVHYMVKETSGTVGYSYKIASDTSSRVFSLPLRDIHVLWGDSLYVYTTPTAQQEGYLYKVVQNDLVYVTSGARGLTALTSKDTALVTSSNGTEVTTSRIEHGFKDIPQPFPLIPEKCVVTSRATYCAIPKENLDAQSFPDAWYKGTVSYTDSLWEIYVTDGGATMVVDFLAESGRAIDVSTIGANMSGALIYFINKNDNTLWEFDTTL